MEKRTLFEAACAGMTGMIKLKYSRFKLNLKYYDVVT